MRANCLSTVALTIAVSVGCGGQQPMIAATEQSKSAPPPPIELTPEDAAEIPPFPPRNVEIHVDKSAVTLVWDQFPRDYAVKYLVYRKEAARLVKIGETSEASFVDASPRRSTAYSVSLVNIYGAESPLTPAVKPSKRSASEK